MISDARHHTNLGKAECDVIVVGSGPVGLILARALTDRGMEVIVLESGPYGAPDCGSDDTAVLSEGDELDCVDHARTRQVGGGLNLWGGQLGLLEDCDFMGVPAWPISRNEAYAFLDETLAIAGIRADGVKARLRVGSTQDTAEGANAFNLKLVETAWLPQPKLSRQFWSWLRTSAVCRLWYNATCVGITTRVAQGAMVASIRTEGRGDIEVQSRHLVLAAGTIENARLLMLPNLNAAQAGLPCPWAASPWLGRGFNDHLDAQAGDVAVIDHARVAGIFDSHVRKGIKFLPKLAWFDRAAQSSPLGTTGMLDYSIKPGQLLQDVSLLLKTVLRQPKAQHLAQLPAAVLGSVRQIAPLAVRYASQRRIGRPQAARVSLRVSVEQPARMDSHVRLSPSKHDRHAMPRTIVAWSRGEAELTAMAEFAMATSKWFQAQRLGTVTVDPRLLDRCASFWGGINAGLHHAGTTRMSGDISSGVVDPNLRVHGTRGLYVCGASVFPTSGFINPTLTAMALAVRLAEHLSTDRRGTTPA